MDVIQLSGYTEDEKLEIAKRYLVPKQLEAHGLDAERIDVADTALRMIIREYTREAGVRGLERRIADLCRKAARKVATATKESSASTRSASASGSARAASPARCGGGRPILALRRGSPYTAVGGDILFIEAQAYPGKGKLTITGPARRGDAGVGARGALVGALAHRSCSASSRAGSPSTTSTSTSRPARSRRTGRRRGSRSRRRSSRSCAASRCRATSRMTGEITLTGQVLPIGGVRDKVLAAQRAGVHASILPRENEPDLDELPPRRASDLSSSSPTRSKTCSAARSTDGDGRSRPRAVANGRRSHQAARSSN